MLLNSIFLARLPKTITLYTYLKKLQFASSILTTYYNKSFIVQFSELSRELSNSVLPSIISTLLANKCSVSVTLKVMNLWKEQYIQEQTLLCFHPWSCLKLFLGRELSVVDAIFMYSLFPRTFRTLQGK